VPLVPVLLLGVTLVSGVLGGETYGRDPQLGVLLGLATSVAYAGFLLVLRQGSRTCGGWPVRCCGHRVRRG
jgi:drug/metabolite transporter (DMT)-like permease